MIEMPESNSEASDIIKSIVVDDIWHLTLISLDSLLETGSFNVQIKRSLECVDSSQTSDETKEKRGYSDVS